MTRRDVYVLLTNFNVFLYAAVAAALPSMASGGAAVGAFMAFWALALWAGGPLVDQAVLTRAFMRAALVRAHSTAVPDAQVRALWSVLHDGGGDGGGGGGDSGCGGDGATAAVRGSDFARATTVSLARLVRHVRELHTGDAGGEDDDDDEEPGGGGGGGGGGLDAHTARELRAALRGSDGGGGGGDGAAPVVTYDQFAQFFRATGGLIDLNAAGAASRRG
jgi:hypothetical protein